MGTRRRDYAAELQRRNERAKSQGFSSYAQLRRARRKNPDNPVPPVKRGPGPTTAKRNARAQRKGFRNAYEERRFRSTAQLGHIEQRCYDWSDLHARADVGRYEPNKYTGKYSREEYTETYYNAFVQGRQRHEVVRRRGSAALRHWIVDIQENPHLAEGDQYDDRYDL